MYTFVYYLESGAGVELEFEWDEEKARANLAKHRVSFLTAAEIFANEMLERDRGFGGGKRVQSQNAE